MPKLTEHCAYQLHLHHSRLGPVQSAPVMSILEKGRLVSSLSRVLSSARASSQMEADTNQSQGLMCTHVQMT